MLRRNSVILVLIAISSFAVVVDYGIESLVSRFDCSRRSR